MGAMAPIPPIPPPPIGPIIPAGLGAPQLKQLDLLANTLAPHRGHAQSPPRCAAPWPPWPPCVPTNRSTWSASWSSTARRAAMTTPLGPLASHFPLPFSTFIVAPVWRSISLIVAPPLPMTRPSCPGHGISIATCSFMSSPSRGGGRSVSSSGATESGTPKGAIRRRPPVGSGAILSLPPTPLLSAPSRRSPFWTTRLISACALATASGAPVTTATPRSRFISTLTANSDSTRRTVSPPLPMTRPSLPFTRTSAEASPVDASRLYAGKVDGSEATARSDAGAGSSAAASGSGGSSSSSFFVASASASSPSPRGAGFFARAPSSSSSSAEPRLRLDLDLDGSGSGSGSGSGGPSSTSPPFASAPSGEASGSAAAASPLASASSRRATSAALSPDASRPFASSAARSCATVIFAIVIVRERVGRGEGGVSRRRREGGAM